jgi:hypothetical protein
MATRARAGRSPLITLIALAFAACGEEPTGNRGSILVSVSPGTLSVPQGGTGSVTATLARSGGFAGNVNLAVTGLPAGVTATVAPAQLTSSAVSATINVSVAATVAQGTHAATITATGQGVAQATTTFQLSVSAAPDYTLSASPATLSVAAGLSGGTTVNIARNNYAGAVALTLLNPPAGITGAFTPASASANTSALSIGVAASVAPGSYALTIQGSATGLPNRSTSLQLTVTAPPVGTRVEYQFCDSSSPPVFFAFQDGTGAWQAVTASTAGGVTRFAFTLTQLRGGVMIVTRLALAAGPVRFASLAKHKYWDRVRSRIAATVPTTSAQKSSRVDIYLTEVLYGTSAELAVNGGANCAETPPTKTVTGNVAGVPVGAVGIVSLGLTSELFIAGTSSNPMTFIVPPGPQDLMGSRVVVPGGAPDKLLLVRNLDIPNGGSLPAPIDFNEPSSFAPATAAVTITGAAAGEDLLTTVDLVTANGMGTIWSDLRIGSATTRTWAGLPSTVMQTTDYHGLAVFASPPTGSFDVRVTLRFVGPVSNQTLALGAAMNLPTTSQVGAGFYPRFRFQGTMPAEYNSGASLQLFGNQEFGNFYAISATRTYLAEAGNALAYDFTMPDIASVAGFPLVARLSPGDNTLAVIGSGFTAPGIFDPVPALGSEFKAAARSTTLIVP